MLESQKSHSTANFHSIERMRDSLMKFEKEHNIDVTLPGLENIQKVIETKFVPRQKGLSKKSKSTDMLKYTAANNKALAVYQKRLRKTYIKPDEEKAL